MGVALRLPSEYVWTHAKQLAVLLFVVMPLTWMVASGLAWLVLGLPLSVSLVLGAVVTPTDPVVASAIVTGGPAERALPASLRHLISGESGANDGLAYVFVALPLAVGARGLGPGLERWFLEDVLFDVVVTTAVGAGIGAIVGRLLVRRHGVDDPLHTSLLALAAAIGLALLGAAKLAGTDGIIAVFAAGLGFNWYVRGEAQAQYERMQEVIKRFFDVPVFLLFGALLPWTAWARLGWLGLAFALAVLVFKRAPFVYALRRFMPAMRTRAQALYVGWFGPVGAAAILYAEWGRVHDRPGLWPAASLVVALSILLHGLSAVPLTHSMARLSGRQVEAPDGARPAE